MEKKMVTSVATRVNISVFSYEEDIKGVIRNDFLDQDMLFRNTWEMVSILESIFNELSFPQAFVDDKKFLKKKKKQKEYKNNYIIGDEMNSKPKKTKAKFIVNVQFRQNATWQGTIQWVEENRTQSFRSALEMLKLMDEALTEGDQLTAEEEEE